MWTVSTLCLESIVSPLRLRWVKGVCMFRCNLPPALLAEYRGLLRATAVTRSRTDTEYESAHDVTLEKKCLPTLLPGLELATFRSRVRRSVSKVARLSVMASQMVSLFVTVRVMASQMVSLFMTVRVNAFEHDTALFFHGFIIDSVSILANEQTMYVGKNLKAAVSSRLRQQKHP